MNPSDTILSTVDCARLQPLVRDAIVSGSTPKYLIAILEAKLKQARVVEPEDMPADVVTMNSQVRVRDLDIDEVETYTLVYPSFADIAAGNLSVLTPIGAGVLGHVKGATIVMELPYGFSRVRLEDVHFQPGSVGQYDV